jgi:hypothetical protein
MKFPKLISHRMNRHVIAVGALMIAFLSTQAQEQKEAKETSVQKEEDYYRIFSLPIPQHVILEVGGLATMSDGALAVCTSRERCGSCPIHTSVDLKDLSLKDLRMAFTNRSALP